MNTKDYIKYQVDYLKFERGIIFKDEFSAYRFLRDLYVDERIDKKMFWLAAGITTAMLTHSYVEHWKDKKKVFEEIKKSSLEDKLK